MRLIHPSETLRELLTHYDRQGGVIEHLLLQVDPDQADSTYEQHRQAAHFAVWELERRHASHVSWFYHRTPEDEWQRHCTTIRIEPDRLSGERIPLAQFLGDPDPEITGHGLPGCGYLYAFRHPPHPMRIKDPALTALSDSVLEHLVGGPSPDLVIHAWTTDWADYFEAGHEWWGSFLWTVENPITGGEIAVIIASTTD